jgi:hypothetical protein
MNWEEVGAIGQVLGSIAVFITLSYLSIQVRHARIDAERSLRLNRLTNGRELMLLGATDERIAHILEKGNQVLGRGTRTPSMLAFVEKAGVTEAEASGLFYYEMVWWQHRAFTIRYIGELSDEERAEFDGGIRFFYGATLNRLWYETEKPRLNQRTVRYVDDVLAQRI